MIGESVWDHVAAQEIAWLVDVAEKAKDDDDVRADLPVERKPTMNEGEQEFIVTMEELLEADSGSLDIATPLASLSSWDSLTIIGFLSIADSKYGARVEPAELRKCKCVADLLKLVEKK